MDEVRQFKGIWIPADIWLREDLTATEKVLLADIDSFTGNGHLFFKSNATLVKELGVSESTVKRAVKHLSDLRLVLVLVTSRKRIIRSVINSGQNERPSGQTGSDSVQNEPTLGSKRPPNKPISNTDTSSKRKELVFPFEDELFVEHWDLWLAERRERRYGKYTFNGEQAALYKLYKESGGDMGTAIEMINESIANGWRGIFPLKRKKNDTDSKKGFSNSEYSDYLSTLD